MKPTHLSTKDDKCMNYLNDANNLSNAKDLRKDNSGCLVSFRQSNFQNNLDNHRLKTALGCCYRPKRAVKKEFKNLKSCDYFLKGLIKSGQKFFTTHDVELDRIVHYIQQMSRSTGFAFPSTRRMCADLKIQERKLYRQLARLKKLGIIHIENIYNTKKKKGGECRLIFLGDAINKKEELIKEFDPKIIIRAKCANRTSNEKVIKILYGERTKKSFENRALENRKPSDAKNANLSVRSSSSHYNILSSKYQVCSIKHREVRTPERPWLFNQKSGKIELNSLLVTTTEREALVRCYGEQIVSLVISNYRKTLDKAIRDNNLYGKFSKKRPYFVIKSWCEEKFLRKMTRIKAWEKKKKSMSDDENSTQTPIKPFIDDSLEQEKKAAMKKKTEVKEFVDKKSFVLQFYERNRPVLDAWTAEHPDRISPYPEVLVTRWANDQIAAKSSGKAFNSALLSQYQSRA